MKIKKIACTLLAVAMIWAMASCATGDNQVTTLTDPPTAPPASPTEPSGDAEPNPTGPATPTDPIVPTDPSEPTGPVDPVDPTEPSEPDVPEHQHSYAEEVTEATCTEDGFTTYTCKCGDTYTGSKVAATGHTWSEWVTIEEPTQTISGLAGRNCTVCGETETKELAVIIPDHTHSFTGEVTKAATCTAEGAKTFICSCGSSYTERIVKTNHSYKETVTAPTCTAQGFTTYKCSACGDSYKDSFVAASGHKYGAYTSNGDATCAKDGTKTAKCTVCSVTNTVTDTGSAKGHSFISYKPNDDATCIKDGTKTATCSNGCGTKDTVTDTGSAKGHSYKETVTAPTCTAQGYTTYKCNTCGNTYKDSYVTAIGHKYGAYTSNGDATCAKDGTKTATCSACGKKNTVTDVGSITDHNYVVIKTVDSFITGAGFQRYECSFCRGTYTESLPEWTEEECEQFLRDVEDAAVKYINQFRLEEGSTEAAVLPGLRQVAQYRAVQLQSNFAHSTTDLREAYAYYQYGEWVDNTAYGGTAYYTANAKEAIATRSPGDDRTADEIGYALACQIRNSAKHWEYVGHTRFPYIAVGVDWSYAMQFTMCILQTSENYG